MAFPLVVRPARWMRCSLDEFQRHGGAMNIKSTAVLLLVLITAIPLTAHDKKNKDAQKGIVEKMEAVPCGAKQRGLAGLGWHNPCQLE